MESRKSLAFRGQVGNDVDTGSLVDCLRRRRKRKRMNKTTCLTTAVALTLGCASSAFAGGFLEVEPNDTFATAQTFGGDPFDLNGTFQVLGELGTNDVDFYAVDLVAGYYYRASVFDYTPGDPFDNDSFLGVFAPDGTLFDTDDDDGPGFMSSYDFIAPETGTWAFAVTGFGDTDFDGSHGENFEYTLVFSRVVPAPGALALLGIAGLAARRRRRA